MLALTTTGCDNNSKQNNILNSGYVGMIDGETTKFQIHAKCGTLSFNGIASEISLIPINDFLASIGLEDYTKFEYSTGELIDINSYINMSNKVLKKILL